MIGRNVSEGEASRPGGPAAPALGPGRARHADRGTALPPGTRPAPEHRVGCCTRGGSATPQQRPRISHRPHAFSTQQYKQKHITSACLLSHCPALNSRYWVAAQEILFCQKACYIQLDVCNVNLFGIKHQ